MKLIPLTQGQFAMVDDEDYDELMKYKWYASKEGRTFYAARHKKKGENDGRGAVKMHRQILGLADYKIKTDHEDHNGLNNQKSNITAVTHQQNHFNEQPSKNGSSKYLGVLWATWANKWRAMIMINGKSKHIGYFKSEEDAAKARDMAALKYFGDRAYLNISQKQKLCV